MRRTFVAANWKMNGLRSNVIDRFYDLSSFAPSRDIDVVLIPSLLYLAEAQNVFSSTPFRLGAQNCSPDSNVGAQTGEVSALQLSEYCDYILVGHSERRMLFKEDNTLISSKVKDVLNSKLNVILCVGETKVDRENGVANQVVLDQLESIVLSVGIESFSNIIIAYEPLWAIGTGLSASPEIAQDMHLLIRNYLARYSLPVSKETRVIYGGSVNSSNAKNFFRMPDIDGALVGSASLCIRDFKKICQDAGENYD